MQILILGHWHTGSSILARAFQICGMQVGNALTGWDEDCEAQCEHSLLNRIGDELCTGKRTDLNEAQAEIENFLHLYDMEANVHNWSHYGFKITHALQTQAWPAFKNAFEVKWPEAKYIISIRVPIGVMKSTGDAMWEPQMIANSIKSTLQATDDLFKEKGASLLMYPTIWTSGGIRNVIGRLGLTWDEKVIDLLFDPSRQKTFTEEELIELGQLF